MRLIATLVFVALLPGVIAIHLTQNTDFKKTSVRTLRSVEQKQIKQLKGLYHTYKGMDESDEEGRVRVLSEMMGIMAVMDPRDIPADIATFMRSASVPAVQVGP